MQEMWRVDFIWICSKNLKKFLNKEFIMYVAARMLFLWYNFHLECGIFSFSEI